MLRRVIKYAIHMHCELCNEIYDTWDALAIVSRNIEHVDKRYKVWIDRKFLQLVCVQYTAVCTAHCINRLRIDYVAVFELILIEGRSLHIEHGCNEARTKTSD